MILTSVQFRADPCVSIRVVFIGRIHIIAQMNAQYIKERLRPYFSGMVPLFVFAHFGHHITGAMLRPLAPMIRTDLGLSYTQVGLMLSVFAITNGISQLPAGWMADKIGTRFIILLSITGVAIAGFFIGFTNSFVMLIALLIVTGLLGGGYHPAAATALSASIPEQYRGRSLGIHFVGGSSTFWVIPLVAAPIAAGLGWRAPYLILAAPTIILGIVIYILVGRYLKAQAKASTRTEDVDASAARMAFPWGRLIPFLALTVLTGTLVQSSSAFLSIYAVDSLGVSEATAAMLMAVQPFIQAVAAPLGGYMADRFGPLKVLVTMSFLAAPLIFFVGPGVERDYPDGDYGLHRHGERSPDAYFRELHIRQFTGEPTGYPAGNLLLFRHRRIRRADAVGRRFGGQNWFPGDLSLYQLCHGSRGAGLLPAYLEKPGKNGGYAGHHLMFVGIPQYRSAPQLFTVRSRGSPLPPA